MEVAVHLGQEVDHTLGLFGVVIGEVSLKVIIFVGFHSPHGLQHPAEEYFCFLLILFLFLCELVQQENSLVYFLPGDELEIFRYIFCLVGSNKDSSKHV